MPNIATGTYTGSGATLSQRIDLSFQPDLVIVAGGSRAIMWRNRTSWHGRTQHFSGASSLYALGPHRGQIWQPFTGDGFSVTGNANDSAATYYYVAIADEDGEMLQEMSWIGNAQNGRSLSWTDAAPDAVWVKRDSSSASQWRWAGGAAAVDGDYQGGTNASIASINSDGITVSNAASVNQNDNASLGEGTEGVAWFAGDCFEVVTYTGNATSDRLIATSFEPAAAILIDATNNVSGDTDRHALVTADMATGAVKPFDTTAVQTSVIGGLEAGGVRLTSGDYNVSGRSYAVLVLKSSTASQSHPAPELNGKRKAVALARGSGRINLADNTLSGASTIEYYGRPRYTEHNDFVPLLLLGNGSATGTKASNAGEFNGGLFLYSVDPNTNGWLGSVIRWVHTDYLSRDKDESSINYYSLNSGIAVRSGMDIHLLLTHDGSGHWRLYLNGRPVKDYHIDLDQATYGNRRNGGDGSELDTVVNALLDDASYSDRLDPRVYRAAWWTSELTQAQALARYQEAAGLGAYTGPDPLASYDWTATGAADGATVTGGTVVARDSNEPDYESCRHVGLEVNTGGTTTQTFTDAIPAAGRYLIGVTGWATDITSVTAAGQSATEISGSQSTSTITASFWLVDAESDGDVVVVLPTTPAACAIHVWDATGLEAAGAVAATDGANTSVDSATINLSGVPRGYRVFCWSTKAAGTQTGVGSVRNDMDLDAWANVGSTSRAVAASSVATGSDTTQALVTWHGGSTSWVVSMVGLRPTSLYTDRLQIAGQDVTLYGVENSSDTIYVGVFDEGVTPNNAQVQAQGNSLDGEDGGTASSLAVGKVWLAVGSETPVLAGETTDQPTTFTRATLTTPDTVRVYASAAIDTATVGTGDFSISGNTVSGVSATTGYVDVTFSNPVSLGDVVTASVDYGVKDADGLLIEPVGLTVRSSQVARIGMGLGLGM